MPDPIAPTGALNGKQNEATLDQANIAMRSMPWYQDMLKSFGQDPNNVHLNNSQKTQIVRGAQAHGFVIDEGDMQIDNSGNIDKKGHALRNTLIVAGIAGATIATMGAAGAFSGAAATGMAGGAAGAGAAGAGGAGAAGLGAGTLFGGVSGATLGSTAVGSGMLGGIAGGAGLAGGAAAAGAFPGAALIGGAGAVPAAAGGALVPTTAGSLASLSGGSMLAGGAGTTAATGGGIGSTLLGAAKNYLGGGGSGGNGYLDTAQRIASGLTDLQRGRAEGRERETMLAQGQNQSANQRYLAQLQAERDTLAAPATRAGNAVRGDILANAKPFSWTGGSDKVGNIPVPKFEGGMSPSMFSDATRTLGGLQSQEALSSQQAGSPVKAPSLIEGPQAGAGDSWLNTAATLASLGSQIPYGTKKKTVYNDGEIN